MAIKVNFGIEEAGCWFKYLGNGYYEYRLAANPKTHMTLWKSASDYWHVASPGERTVRSFGRTAAVLEMVLRFAESGRLTQFEFDCLTLWRQMRQSKRGLNVHE